MLRCQPTSLASLIRSCYDTDGRFHKSRGRTFQSSLTATRTHSVGGASCKLPTPSVSGRGMPSASGCSTIRKDVPPSDIPRNHYLSVKLISLWLALEFRSGFEVGTRITRFNVQPSQGGKCPRGIQGKCPTSTSSGPTRNGEYYVDIIRTGTRCESGISQRAADYY